MVFMNDDPNNKQSTTKEERNITNYFMYAQR